MATSSYASSPRLATEGDFEEQDSFDMQQDRDLSGRRSDEDTEDASETDAAKQEEEFTGIKEQMYQDKLAQLKKQLVQLKDGTLPEYMKKLRKIEQTYKERLRMNDIWLQYERDLIEREYVKEKKAAAIEFEEKKIELKEQLIMELEEKKRQVEGERSSMELTGDSMEMKAKSTRILRRRGNDPMPLSEKRRKPTPAQLNYCLSEDEIFDDLKIINKISGKPLVAKKPQTALPTTNPSDFPFEARIDDGRLHYDKKWFHRGQQVYLESKEAGKISAVITAVGTQEVWLRRTSDNGKLRVYITQLQKGKYAVRRRP